MYLREKMEDTASPKTFRHYIYFWIGQLLSPLRKNGKERYRLLFLVLVLNL